MSHPLIRTACLSQIVLALLAMSACNYAAGASFSHTPSVVGSTASAQSASPTTASAHATATSSATQSSTAPASTAAPTAPTRSPTVVRIIASGAIASGSPMVATCPNGALALSGGWYFGNNSGAEVKSESRYMSNGWVVWPDAPPGEVAAAGRGAGQGS